MSQLDYLRHDLYRYIYPTDDIQRISFIKMMRIILFTQGIWAIIFYRLRRWLQYESNIPLIRRLCVGLTYIINFIFVECIAGISIAPEADIGPGLYIGHYGNIFIGEKTKLGKFCNISHENTLGYSGFGQMRGVPEIGDFVYIAPGAKVVGKIQIGSNVVIGPNTVVTKHIPDNATVFGMPGRIVNYDSSKQYIRYSKEKSKKYLAENNM